jgi:hypothetical protein
MLPRLCSLLSPGVMTTLHLLYPSSYPLCNIAAHHPDLAVPPLTQPASHSFRLETQPIPGRTIVRQQTEETNIVPRHPSTDYTPHAWRFQSPSAATSPAHSKQQDGAAPQVLLYRQVGNQAAFLPLLPMASYCHLSRCRPSTAVSPPWSSFCP